MLFIFGLLKSQEGENVFFLSAPGLCKKNGNRKKHEDDTGAPADPEHGGRGEHCSQLPYDPAEGEPPGGGSQEYAGNEKHWREYRPEAREDCREAQDGHGVGEGEKKS